jgi:hypothetical protein
MTAKNIRAMKRVRRLLMIFFLAAWNKKSLPAIIAERLSGSTTTTLKMFLFS